MARREPLTPSRRHRIVRRAVMALAVVVMLPVLYFGSLMTLGYCWGAGWLPMSPYLQAYSTPCWWYIQNEMPGHAYIRGTLEWCGKTGQDMWLR